MVVERKENSRKAEVKTGRDADKTTSWIKARID
jgi:hypothetical protein